MPTTRAKQYKRPLLEEPQWYENKKLKKLTAKWYAKLKKSGFEDKEEFDSPLELMKQRHNTWFKEKFDEGKFLDRQRYYELASQLVHTYPFKKKLDQTIWFHHSDGVPERQIAVLAKCTYTYVRKIVKKVKLAIKRDAVDILKDIDRMKDD